MLFAILGLRTLYFVLEALKEMLHHLEKAIIALLFFIAIKLALSASLHLTGFGYDISPTVSLAIVIITLSVGVIASLLHKNKEDKGEKEDKSEKPLKGSKDGEPSGLVFASSDVSELSSKKLSEKQQADILNNTEDYTINPFFSDKSSLNSLSCLHKDSNVNNDSGSDSGSDSGGD